MGCLWDDHVMPMGCPCSVGYPWTAHGLSPGCQWDAHGLRPWIAPGMHMDFPWDAHVLPMCCPRAVRGLPSGIPMGCP